MKYRAPLLLILLVVLPVLVLGWLGLRLQHNEQQLVGLQLQKLIEQQLQSVDQQLQIHFQQLEGVLQQQAVALYRQTDPDYSTEALRRYVKSSVYVQQLFVLGGAGSGEDMGERLFPPLGQPLSLDEQQFVEQMQPLWQSPYLFHSASADPVIQTPAVAQAQAQSPSPATRSSLDYLASGQLQPRAKAELSVGLADRPAEVPAKFDSAVSMLADRGTEANLAERKSISEAARQEPAGEMRQGLGERYAHTEAESTSGVSPGIVALSEADAVPASPRARATAPAAKLATDLADDAAADFAADPADLTTAASSASGWIAWYANAGLMHVRWWRDPEGRTLGFVLNGARLLSDLINSLPDSEQGDAQLGDAEIRLLDSRGETLYSWGRYRGEGSVLRTLGLSHPLGSWRLEYQAPALQSASVPGLIGIAVPLLLLGIGLGLLGYLLYREHGRELRLASQRVNFVNQVSHELKTPLTNVRLYAEMLQERLCDDDADPGVRRYLDVITGESQRLSRLIDNVLSFSRLQRNQLALRFERGDVDEQIARIVQTFKPLLAQRGIDAIFEPGIGQSLSYDAAALEQILNNLLSNCEKYAADSGLLHIRSWRDGSGLCVQVQDQGPGIDTAEQQRIFEPFYRSSNKLTDGVAGTGIGLGLARDLARAHGGDLSLEPCEQGACFMIRLEIKA